MSPVLYLLIPCYNEESVLPQTAPMFLSKIQNLIEGKQISAKSRILFINDGSRDRTWEIILQLASEDERYVGVSFSRNFGHQNAVWCGLMEARERCDITISLDCDGQDDIDAIDEMIRQYQEGSDIVYGVRNNRDTDSFFKRVSAESWYKFLKWMGSDVVFNHADFRLVSARAIDCISEFGERNLYLRGLFPLIGFKTSTVYYKRGERIAGESRYPLAKQILLAMDGLTSMTMKPVRLILGLGVGLILISLLVGVLFLLMSFFGHFVTGWSALLCVVCLMSGLQLFSLGVVAEYIGRMNVEIKARPRYIVSERTENAMKNAPSLAEADYLERSKL